MKSVNQCLACGNDDFITPLNSYDIYQIVDGEAVFIRTEIANMEFVLYGRECGQKAQLANKEPEA